MVVPNYVLIDKFESDLDQMKQKAMMTDYGAEKWIAAIKNIKHGDSSPMVLSKFSHL